MTADRGATMTISSAAGMIAVPAVERRVAEHVLKVLLADEHRAHQRPEDDDAGQGRNPERRPGGDVEVVQRVLGPSLTDDEGDRGRDRDERQADDQRPHVRDGREVDRQDQRPDEQRRQDAAKVVDGVGRSR